MQLPPRKKRGGHLFWIEVGHASGGRACSEKRTCFIELLFVRTRSLEREVARADGFEDRGRSGAEDTETEGICDAAKMKGARVYCDDNVNGIHHILPDGDGELFQNEARLRKLSMDLFAVKLFSLRAPNKEKRDGELVFNELKKLGKGGERNLFIGPLRAGLVLHLQPSSKPAVAKNLIDITLLFKRDCQFNSLAIGS